MKQFVSVVLAWALCMSVILPAFASEAPSEIKTAGVALQERGIYQGDDSGALRLNEGLNRAELAAILARLDGGTDEDMDWYSWACYFTDVPEWAKGYVGYCVTGLLLKGYGDLRYGSNDPVTPNAACTMVLRTCGYESGEGSAWNYNTAASYAVSHGLISQSTAQAAVITRGELAVLIYRALVKAEGDAASVLPPAPAQTPDTSEYTIIVDHWSREDFSQQANPKVFSGPYTRELYNTIRQTMLDGASETPAYTMVSKEEYEAVKSLIDRLDGVLRYEHHVPQNFTNYWQYLDYFAVSAEMPEQYQASLDFIQPVIAEIENLDTDSEKIEHFNDYLRTLLAYKKGAVSGIAQTFAPHAGELDAACGSYARAMKFLCAASDIPCFTISTDDHTWNLVYADGQWLHVDVSANDLRGRNSVLLVRSYNSEKDDIAPEATAFLKELLAPGSTK